MRDVSHSSWIQIISDSVEEWRARNNWCRETVCAEFVEAFKTTERPNAWNIEFSNHHDPIQRRKNDADKIMRWLDDVRKDNNLLHTNFARVIVMTFPLDIRMKCVARMFCSMGISVGLMEECSEDQLSLSHICDAQIDSAMALKATTEAFQNPTPENIERACIANEKTLSKQRLIGRVLVGLKAKVTKAKAATGAAIGKLVRKERVTP